jgi:Anti-sigma-K factor rskA
VWHPDPDQLTLAALPAERSDPRVVAHLDECALCRGQVDSLRRTVVLARDGADAVDDDSGPPDAVWRAIADELALEEPPAPPRVPARRRRRRVLVPVAAAVVGLLAGVAVGYAVFSGASGTGSVVARLDPFGPTDPGGSGRVSMVHDRDGERMDVTLTGVDDLAGGDYLQVWLLDPASARLVAMGGLAPVAGEAGAYRGSFTVPVGLPLAAFGTVDVSIEKWDGDPGHSQRSVLRGQLA